MEFIHKNRYLSLALLLGVSLALISACISQRPNPSVESAAPALSQRPVAAGDYEAAYQFDQWLKGHLSQESAQQYHQGCQDNLQHSPFCFSVLNFFQLEARRLIQQDLPKRKTTSKSISPKIKKDSITNWIELRFSPVVATLRGLNRVKPTDIELLKTKALAETACPNNIAVSLAAFLEDQLPSQVSYSLLGQLYEKGGACPSENPGDSETLMTRAGLMYWAGGEKSRAESCFQTSAKDKDAFRSRALYWLSRIYQESGQSSRFKETLNELKTQYPFSFHTLMALHGVKEDPGSILKTSATAPRSRSEQAPQLNNLIEQVEILHDQGFQQSADKVLSWIISDSERAEPEFMLYVSDFKHSHGNTLGQLKILTNILYANPQLTNKAIMERYFPKLYFPVFEKHSQGLDPYLLMSIARRESAFNPKAVSRARAKGLMQISPGTHRRLSSTKNIFDPEANISVGSRYLADLIKKSNGFIHLALAGYNAGPNRVDLWVARYATTDPVLFIDLIPFKETREYVASVLRNYYWYRRLHEEEKPATIEALLTSP